MLIPKAMFCSFAKYSSQIIKHLCVYLLLCDHLPICFHPQYVIATVLYTWSEEVFIFKNNFFSIGQKEVFNSEVEFSTKILL